MFNKFKKRILFIADAHLPHNRNDFLKIKDQSYLLPNSGISNKTLRLNRLLLSLSQNQKSIDFIICLGDMLEGHRVSGMISSKVFEGVSAVKHIIRHYFPDTKLLFCPGNHELGFELPFSWHLKGGPNKKAFEAYQKYFGKLFYSLNINGTKFLIICSDLELINEDSFPFIKDLKEKQRSFIEEFFEKVKSNNEKVFLILHDPDALLSLDSTLTNYRKNISKTFCGHIHSKLILKGYVWASYLYAFGIFKRIIKYFIRKKFSKYERSLNQYLARREKISKMLRKYKVKLVGIPSKKGRNKHKKDFYILEV